MFWTPKHGPDAFPTAVPILQTCLLPTLLLPTHEDVNNECPYDIEEQSKDIPLDERLEHVPS